MVTVTASGAADPSVDAGTLRVVADGSSPGLIRIRVVDTPPPSLAPIRVSTLKAGESQTIDLAPYLQSGVSNPQPTVAAASQLTKLPVQISSSGSSVTISAGSAAHGHAEFRVVMSDVAGSSGPGRRVEGRIALDILGVPDKPGVPVPGKEVLDSEVTLDWRAPESNGAPIDSYEVQDQSGHVHRCGSTSCDIRGLTNGTTYRFRVRAHNAVGFSAWSDFSIGAMPDDPPNLQGRVHLVEAGDGYLKIDWLPLEVKNGGAVTYRVSWLGGHTLAYSAAATIPNLDNHRRYRFTVIPVNAFSPGAITSNLLQPVGTPATPPPPTVTDQQTPGSAGAVTLSWPEVDANGPGPVRYTVYRNGSPLKNCHLITAHGCDDTSLLYDGTGYQYTLEATNKGDKSSPQGPATTWHAVGKPAAWGAWNLHATGENNQARATFTVPPVRGGTSIVRIYADGAKVQQLSGDGLTEANVVVANNLAPHSVMLEACNEEGNCSQSSTLTVQTWGPLVPNDIQSISANVNVRQISWTIQVDSNGDAATVHVTSDQGRDETFQVPVGVSTVTTAVRELDYSTTESVTVELSDASPDRGPVSNGSSATTEPPPPPTVVLSKGAACNDDPAAGLQPCNASGPPGRACTDASCAFVHIQFSNWTGGPGDGVFCEINGDSLPENPFSRDASVDTSYSFGQPGGTVTAVCESIFQKADSPPLTW